MKDEATIKRRTITLLNTKLYDDDGKYGERATAPALKVDITEGETFFAFDVKDKDGIYLSSVHIEHRVDELIAYIFDECSVHSGSPKEIKLHHSTATLSQ